MPNIDHNHMINSEGDGRLGETTPAQVTSLVNKASASDHIIIHLHGGLIKKETGINIASRLVPYYQKTAGTYPVAFIWETGLFETVKNNLAQIIKEDVFKAIFKRIIKFLWGKTRESFGMKSIGGLDFPTQVEIDRAARFAVDPKKDAHDWDKTYEKIDNFTPKELRDFERELLKDKKLNKALNEIAANVTDKPDVESSKGIITKTISSKPTLMSPSIVHEIQGHDKDNTSKGFISWAKIIRRATKVLKRVVKRFRNGRAHGRYTTIIEEILYEFYIVNAPEIGQAVWGAMKKDSAETFEHDFNGPKRAGRFFWNQLSEKIRQGNRPKVSIVAHSAGAIFASHMIKHVGGLVKNGQLPPDFKFEKVVFLAPAVQSELFSTTIKSHHKMIGQFRMYTLSDKVESGYWEFPGYKGSLLYMVSGLFEKNAPSHDMPLLGMARYFERANIYNGAHAKRVRDYLSKPGRIIWSPNDDTGAGRGADSVMHGAFDETGQDQLTMSNVRQFLEA